MKNLKAVMPKDENNPKCETFTKLCDAMKPIIMMCRLVGLMALKLQENDGKTVIVSGKSDYIYAASFVVTYSIITSFSIYSVLSDEDGHNIVPKVVVLELDCSDNHTNIILFRWLFSLKAA